MDRVWGLLGGPLPGPAQRNAGAGLILGLALFGAGWALVRLCPGPALASFSDPGTQTAGLVFLVAICGDMLAAKPLRARCAAALQGSPMDIRHLTPDYAVSPQILPEDLATLKALGFTTVIDNRPDGEIPAALSAEVMARAAADLGLAFVINPIRPGDFSQVVLATQAAAMGQGKVFAYCASGNRSSCAWAIAAPGELTTDARIAMAAEFGYNLEPLRPLIDAHRG